MDGRSKTREAENGKGAPRIRWNSGCPPPIQMSPQSRGRRRASRRGEECPLSSIKPPRGSPRRESKPAEMMVRAGGNLPSISRMASANACRCSRADVPAGRGMFNVNPSPFPPPCSLEETAKLCTVFLRLRPIGLALRALSHRGRVALSHRERVIEKSCTSSLRLERGRSDCLSPSRDVRCTQRKYHLVADG